jgi:hypothetical protein
MIFLFSLILRETSYNNAILSVMYDVVINNCEFNNISLNAYDTAQQGGLLCLLGASHSSLGGQVNLTIFHSNFSNINNRNDSKGYSGGIFFDFFF